MEKNNEKKDIRKEAIFKLKKIVRLLNDRIKIQNEINNKNETSLDFNSILNSDIGLEFVEKYKKNKRVSLIQKYKRRGYSIKNITIGFGPKKGDTFTDKTKVCLGCLMEKEIKFFWKAKARTKRIPASRCIECERKRMQGKDYVIYSIYKEQRRSSREKGYPAPEYNLRWFIKWCNDSEKFNELYDKWKSSEYDVYLRPSIDRINPLKPYLKNNIQVMTFSENSEKGRTTDKYIHSLNKDNIIGKKSNIETIRRILSYLRYIYNQQKEEALKERYDIKYYYSQEWLIGYVFRNINIKHIINKDISNIKNVNKIFSVEKLLKEKKYSKSNIKIVFYNTDQK